MKKTLILGASDHPYRYSYQAVKLLRHYKHEVIAVGNQNSFIDDVPIQNIMPNQMTDLDTISIYLNPEKQAAYYNPILALKPKRIIFNPGAENEYLSSEAHKEGITTLDACTLVLLKTDQY